MNLLEELYQIQDDLNSVPPDNIPKHCSPHWSRAMNRLMNLISDGERRMKAREFSADLRGPDAKRV